MTSDQDATATTEIREQVRERYAAAARLAAAGRYGQARVEEAACCSPAPVATTDADGREVFRDHPGRQALRRRIAKLNAVVNPGARDNAMVAAWPVHVMFVCPDRPEAARFTTS